MPPLLLAIPLALAAPVPKDFKTEAPPLEGAWRLTAVTIGGNSAGGNLDAIWRFADGSLAIESPPGSTSTARPIRTDRKRSPAGIEIGSEGPPPGIYEIKGDTLTIAYSTDGKTRPAKTIGPDTIRYTLTRVKEK